MAWIFSPIGIGIIVVLIIAIASFIYWKREPIKRWLGRQELDEIEVGAGPLKAKFKEKKPEPSTSSAGVDFGEGSDFTGAKIITAGRDIRRGPAVVAEPPGGKTPGVDFGKESKVRDAEIEAAGRDIVDAEED